MFRLILVSIFICGCGVKNDVIPPEKPWVIFEQSDVINKKKLNKKKLETKDSKNANN